jgi:hypothetical protein
MKRFLLVTVFALGMVGCLTNNADSTYHCRRSVEAAFPGAEISNSPDSDSSFRFLVREPNGAVWYVETMSGSGPQVTKKELIFKAK